MCGSSLLDSNISENPNFHSLVLFICHLLTDGHFRSGHILYDPNMFDDRFITQMESVCSVQIPWLWTDVTQAPASPWQASDSTDHIFQLIFFDPRRLPDEIDHSKSYFTIYRMFVFTSTLDEINLNTINQLDQDLGLKSLIAQHDSENDLLDVQWIGENGELERVFNDEQHEQTIQGHTSDNRFEHLFDRTFGMFEKDLTICIRSFGIFGRKQDAESFTPTFEHEFLYMSNYFNSTLDKSYVKMRFATLDKIYDSRIDSVVGRKERKYHKELSLKYEPIEITNA